VPHRFHPRRAWHALTEDLTLKPERFVDDGSTRLGELDDRMGRIPGMLGAGAGRLLYLLAYAATNGDVVEIGSWQGQSTAFLAQACEDTNNGVVHAIDTFQGNPGKEHFYTIAGGGTAEAAFRRNIAAAGLEHRVHVYPMRSREAHNKIDVPLRMLFIDGEHTYHAVTDDLAFASLVVPDGIIAFDDYDAERCPGVVQAVQDFLGRGGWGKPIQAFGMLVCRRS
jgi:MMP 1-O-methyltransferase